MFTTVVTPRNSYHVPSSEATDTLRPGPTVLPIVEEVLEVQAQFHRSKYNQLRYVLFNLQPPYSDPPIQSGPAPLTADDDNPFLLPAPTAANVRFDLPSSAASVGAESFAFPSPMQSELDEEQGHPIPTQRTRQANATPNRRTHCANNCRTPRTNATPIQRTPGALRVAAHICGTLRVGRHSPL